MGSVRVPASLRRVVWRFDAMAEYKFTDHFSAQINVLNLTNELYYDALYQSNAANVFVARPAGSAT